MIWFQNFKLGNTFKFKYSRFYFFIYFFFCFGTRLIPFKKIKLDAHLNLLFFFFLGYHIRKKKLLLHPGCKPKYLQSAAPATVTKTWFCNNWTCTCGLSFGLWGDAKTPVYIRTALNFFQHIIVVSRFSNLKAHLNRLFKVWAPCRTIFNFLIYFLFFLLGFMLPKAFHHAIVWHCVMPASRL